MTPMPFANCSWVYLPLAAHLCCSVPGREGPRSLGAVCPCPLSPQRLQSSCDDLQMCLQEFPVSALPAKVFLPKDFVLLATRFTFSLCAMPVLLLHLTGQSHPASWLSYFSRKGLSKHCLEVTHSSSTPEKADSCVSCCSLGCSHRYLPECKQSILRSLWVSVPDLLSLAMKELCLQCQSCAGFCQAQPHLCPAEPTTGI